jgi:aspartate ammonia-lyase
LIEVPVVSWAPRDGQTIRCLDYHRFSPDVLGSRPVLVQALLSVKRAALRANLRAGAFSAEVASRLEAAIQRITSDQSRWLDDFPVDLWQGGGAIAINVNLNERIAVEACDGGEWQSWAQHINASQSTSDVCATGLRIAAFRSLTRLSDSIGRLIVALAAKQQEFAGIPTLARTCLRDALPTTLGNKFAAFIEVLAISRQNLAASAARLLEVNLGGTVIGDSTGASSAYFNAVIDELVDDSSLPLRRRSNLLAAAQSSDDLGSVLAEVDLLASKLVRISADLRLLASGPSGGFGEVEFAPLMSGSSFFAGKNNPTIVETLMQAAFQVAGKVRSGMLAVERAELDLNVFDWVAGVNLLDAAEWLSPAIDCAAQYGISTMRANAAQCRRLAEMHHQRKV